MDFSLLLDLKAVESKMTSQLPQKVLPGQPIAPVYLMQNGQTLKLLAGTNVRLDSLKHAGNIIPSLVSTTLGRVEVQSAKDEEGSQIVSVIPKNDPCYADNSDDIRDSLQVRKYKASTPNVNDIVLAKVTRMTNSRVNVEILSVAKDTYEANENERADEQKAFDTSKYDQKMIHLTNLLPTETGEFFKGTIRSQDIRSTERDSVKTWNCFQPGDIVRALVISLGDGVSYYLTTARNDLGVVFAKDANGDLLYPLDWETMISPSTGIVENRKCAKPF